MITEKFRYLFEQLMQYKKVYNVHINKRYIHKFLPPAPQIIDCGAHTGIDSVLLAKYKGSQVYCFEPVPKLYNELEQRTKGFKNIRTFPIALADYTGKATMYVSEGLSDGSSSLLPPKEHLFDHPDVHFDKQIVVDCVTLDEWANKNNIEKIDLLWLDMQGYELPMLKASKSILSTVSAIHTEVSIKETYENVSQYPQLKEFLLSIGFKVEVEAIPKGYDMGNVLFRR